MATGHSLDSSVIIEDYFSEMRNTDDKSEVQSQSLLKATNTGQLEWEGCFQTLKNFVETKLNICGKWTSPGGEVKLFTGDKFTMKWHGRNKKRLAIIRDDVNNSITAKLMKLAELQQPTSDKQHEVSLSNLHLNTAEGIVNDRAEDESLFNLNQAQQAKGNDESKNLDTEIEEQSDLAKLTKKVECIEEAVNMLMATHKANNNRSSCYSTACQAEKLRSITELEEANATIQELRQKIINLENEKSSLVTAIKIIQEDNKQDAPVNKDSHENAEWKQQKRRKKRNRRVTNPSTSGSQEDQDKNQTTPDQNNVNNVDTKNTNINVEHKNTATNVVIAGDSMIKHVNGYKMSNAKTKVKVATFPGCTTLDMDDYIKPLLKKKPDRLILHVGTNSLKGRTTPTSCADEITSLAESIKKTLPDLDLCISALITRLDEKSLTTKARQVNALLKESCVERNWHFIGNDNITENELNSRKIHLNKRGTIMLARNFSNFIHAGKK